MAAQFRPGRCRKAMWWGWGGPAGLCGKDAYGPTAKGSSHYPQSWACPAHGGPPKCEETEFLRNAAIEAWEKEVENA